VLDACASEFRRSPARVLLTPGKPQLAKFELHDKDGAVLFHAFVSMKVLGEMSRGSTAFNVGALFSQILLARRSQVESIKKVESRKRKALRRKPNARRRRQGEES